jgi:hypothetical protein
VLAYLAVQARHGPTREAIATIVAAFRTLAILVEPSESIDAIVDEQSHGDRDGCSASHRLPDRSEERAERRDFGPFTFIVAEYSCSSIVVELRSMAGLANGAPISRLSCASQRGARCGFPRRTKRKRGAVVSLA